MTDREFSQLRIGTIVASKLNRDERYVITGDDEMGGGQRIFAAESIELTPAKTIRIDAGNCGFWSIVY